MFLNIQIDLLILKTYYGQFTLTTKKSLHVIFKPRKFVSTDWLVGWLVDWLTTSMMLVRRSPMRMVSDSDALSTGRISLLYALVANLSSYSRFACDSGALDSSADDVINARHVTAATTRPHIATRSLAELFPVACRNDGMFARRTESDRAIAFGRRKTKMTC